MALVSVYNTGVNPVIYGDGQTIAGLSWQSVEQELVQEYLDERVLILVKDRGARFRPVVEQENQPEATLPDNSEAVETDVPFEAPEEVLASAQEHEEVSTVDTPPNTPKPATMRKTRRRKTTPPVKE